MALAPAPISVASAATPASDGVHVTVTFQRGSPIGLTEVTLSPDPTGDTALLTLIDATITRLIAYRAAYRTAMDDEPQGDDEQDQAALTPAPRTLPVPWTGW